jgi:hypothetical protein
MGCVAITDILAHLTLPSVAPADGKAIQEDGMTAARGDNNPDVIKWVSAWSSSGLAASPLATQLPVSRVLGGLQFNNSFSSEKNHNGTPYTDLDWEGCAVENPDGGSCGITAEQGLYNVLQIYFDGTDAGPFYGVSAGVTPDADAGTLFEFSDAPMNYVQVYDTDIIYANGMGGCRNLSDIFNDTHSCAVLVSSMPTISIDGGSYTAQGLLTLVNQQISLLSESTEPTPPKVSKLPGACLVYEACSTPAGFQPPGCDPDSPGCNFVNQCQTEPLTFNGDAPPDCIPGSVKGELGLSLPSCVGSCQ